MTAVSLKEYAARRAMDSCWTCSLPKRTEIDKGLRDGIKPGAVAAWLRDEEGCQEDQATARSRVYWHAKQGHHNQNGSHVTARARRSKK